MQTFEKNYKNYKLLGTDSVMKKRKDFMTLLVLLHYLVLVLLY